MTQSSVSRSKSKTKTSKKGESLSKKNSKRKLKLKKPIKKIRETVKIQKKKRTNNKVKSQKQMPSKITSRKKRKKKTSGVNKKAIMKQNLLPLVSLPLAAGGAYPYFALVPIGDHQLGDAARVIAFPDQVVEKTYKEDPVLSEQVGEMFSFRVKPEDVSVKPEVWKKIIRTLPENFVIPDPELTSFFDNMSAIQAANEHMIIPELTSEPEKQPSFLLESEESEQLEESEEAEGTLSYSHDSTQETFTVTDVTDVNDDN